MIVIACHFCRIEVRTNYQVEFSLVREISAGTLANRDGGHSCFGMTPFRPASFSQQSRHPIILVKMAEVISEHFLVSIEVFSSSKLFYYFRYRDFLFWIHSVSAYVALWWILGVFIGYLIWKVEFSVSVKLRRFWRDAKFGAGSKISNCNLIAHQFAFSSCELTRYIVLFQPSLRRVIPVQVSSTFQHFIRCLKYVNE